MPQTIEHNLTRATKSDNMLELNSLHKSFGRTVAVDNISLSIRKGEVLGFLGPNAAGKSTTIRMIAGVLSPDSGDAIIQGHSIITDRQNAQKHLGYLPEGAPLYDEMTPPDFLKFLASARGLDNAAREAAVERVIADARIGSVSNKRIGDLSKGFRRRVGLAGAILTDPPVLLLDEPTDGLDPNQKRAVRALIARMAPEKAILITTHTLEEVPAMCSRVVIIDGGRIVADDTPDALGANSGELETAFSELTHAAEKPTA